MFENEFFPTPKEVVAKMLEPYFVPEPDESDDPVTWRKWRHARENSRLNNMSILEPSAGKGDILDYIQDEFIYRGSHKNFYCIESDPDLQHILRGKNYKLIGSDFLNYTGDYYFDLIIMNPPFSNADQHILKAWEILREGEIICLMNAETIRNACTERRQLLRRIIADYNGKVEFIGKAFKNAERPTDVEVCIVRLTKKLNQDRLNFEFKTVTREADTKLSESILNNPVAVRDVVGNMIMQYERTKEYYVKFLESMEGLKFYGKDIVTEYFEFNKLLEMTLSGNKKHDFNTFCDTMKQQIWSVVIRHLNIDKYMTHGVRQNFEQFCQHQGYLDFTKENVAELVEMIFENRYTILDRAIVEVFDVFTRYHSENRCYVEGWKTNDNWKVNKRVILPNWLRMSWEKPADRMRFGAEYQINYHYNSEYADIDKVMCYITGTRYETCHTISNALELAFRRIGKVYKGPHKGECESQFFRIKFFMKGTIHLEFKDDKLWEEFNMRACDGKNWLPEQEKRQWKASKQNHPEPQMNKLRLIA